MFGSSNFSFKNVCKLNFLLDGDLIVDWFAWDSLAMDDEDGALLPESTDESSFVNIRATNKCIICICVCRSENMYGEKEREKERLRKRGNSNSNNNDKKMMEISRLEYIYITHRIIVQ